MKLGTDPRERGRRRADRGCAGRRRRADRGTAGRRRRADRGTAGRRGRADRGTADRCGQDRYGQSADRCGQTGADADRCGQTGADRPQTGADRPVRTQGARRPDAGGAQTARRVRRTQSTTTAAHCSRIRTRSRGMPRDQGQPHRHRHRRAHGAIPAVSSDGVKRNTRGAPAPASVPQGRRSRPLESAGTPHRVAVPRRHARRLSKKGVSRGKFRSPYLGSRGTPLPRDTKPAEEEEEFIRIQRIP